MDNLTLKIAAVVVTYKNLDLLKKCIAGVRSQSRKVDHIIVVNNGANDNTHEWLSHQNDIDSISQKNTGGAGGFKVGIKRAYEMNFDWIWCLDQDIESKKMVH